MEIINGDQYVRLLALHRRARNKYLNLQAGFQYRQRRMAYNCMARVAAMLRIIERQSARR